MDLGFVLRTWLATLRRQRLLWMLGLVLFLAYLPMVLLGSSLEFIPETWFEGALSEADLLQWALGLLASLAVAVLFLAAVSLAVNAGIILIAVQSYPDPGMRTITWSDLRPRLLRGTLRLGLLALLGTGIAVFVLLLAALPVVGGLAGLSAFAQDLSEADVAFWVALLGMGVTGLFLFACCIPLAVLLLGPFFTASSIAVVAEEERPFLEALKQGLTQAWRKYGWWLLTMAGGMALAFMLNLLPAPFRIVAGVLEEMRNQGLEVPLVLSAAVNGVTEVLNGLITVVQNVALFTLYTVVYLHLRERAAETPTASPSVHETHDDFPAGEAHP